MPLAHRPVVMGFGPAGMLAAFYLAREGYRPIVFERGQDVDTRSQDVETFWKGGRLSSLSLTYNLVRVVQVPSLMVN